MVASGPFAQGPLQSNKELRKQQLPTRVLIPTTVPSQTSAPSTSVPITAQTPSTVVVPDAVGLLSKPEPDSDVEVYSDNEEDKIIDMDMVHTLDWMAPESLKRGEERKKRGDDVGGA